LQFQTHRETHAQGGADQGALGDSEIVCARCVCVYVIAEEGLHFESGFSHLVGRTERAPTRSRVLGRGIMCADLT
jgi:hypothetical protein